MNKEEERQAFLRKIDSLPWDESHEARLVFSDWLLEHDEPEEAERQRNYVAAERWLRDFADKCGETCTEGYGDGHWDAAAKKYVQHTPEVWEKITYEMVVKVGCDYVASNGRDYFTQLGSERARDMMDEKTTTEYWRCWEIVTGIMVPEKLREDKWFGAPFSCSC